MDFRIPNYICFVYRKLQAAATDAPEPSWNGLTMQTPEPRPPARRSRFGFSTIPRKVRWIVFSNAFGAIGFGYLIVFITAYFPETGVSSQVVGLLLGAVGVSMVVSAAPLGIPLGSPRTERSLADRE